MANDKVYIFDEDNIRINVYEEAQSEFQLINENPSIEIVRIYEPGAQGPKGNDGGSYILPENIVSSSAQIANDISGSFVSSSSELSNRIGVFEGKTLFSSSQQINFQDISGSFSTASFLQNSFTASFNSFSSSAETKIFRLESVTGSFAVKTEVSGAFTSTSASISNRIGTFESKTLFSGSSQVSYLGLANIPSGIVSGSDQISSSYDLKYETRGRGIISSSNGFISSSTQVDYNSIQNKPTTILSASFALTASYVSGSSSSSVSSSYALTASYASGYVLTSQTSSMSVLSASYAPPSILPANLISSSQQINSLLPNLVSGSEQLSSSFDLRYHRLGTGLISASQQVNYAQLTDIPSGILSSSNLFISSSQQVKNNLPNGTVSSSQQINSGSFSGSFFGNGNGLTDVVSSSYALSASYAPEQVSASYAITASYAMNGGSGGTNIQTIGIRIKTEDTYIIEGSKGFKHIGYNSNITKLRGIANIAGTINLNVKRDGTLLGNYNLTSASSSIDSTLSGWTISLNANDLIEFSVSQSSTYITDLTFFMDLQSI